MSKDTDYHYWEQELTVGKTEEIGFNQLPNRIKMAIIDFCRDDGGEFGHCMYDRIEKINRGSRGVVYKLTVVVNKRGRQGFLNQEVSYGDYFELTITDDDKDTIHGGIFMEIKKVS